MNLVVNEFVLILLCLIDQIMISSASVYHLVSHDGKPRKTPFRSFTSKFKQQCISICGNSCKCHSFTVEMKNTGEVECNFYDTATMKEDLVSATGVHYNIEIRDCKDLYNLGARVSGVYEVNWMGRMKKNIRCNMEIDGGGWTVFQRRYEPLTKNFDLNWDSYKQGFGDEYKEFWLGNDLIHEITSSKPHYILVFGKKANGETAISKYGSFYIENEGESYKIHFNDTVLTNTESLNSFSDVSNGKLDGMKFSTKDRDNDLKGYNCATDRGAFWFNACSFIHPNRKEKIHWYTFNKMDGLEEIEIMFKTM